MELKQGKDDQVVSREKLVDFVNGRLSPEESRELLERIEKSEELSKALEVIIDIVNSLHWTESQKTGFKQSVFNKAGKE